MQDLHSRIYPVFDGSFWLVGLLPLAGRQAAGMFGPDS
jgi:hypothetical protein